ncbi:MAG TPA: endospore germination permease [Bacillota bacterium]|nr:endospore germination permease [Bacillota bacterium]
MNKSNTTRLDHAPMILPGAFFALILASLSGADFLSLPHDAARTGGASGYWGVLVAGIYAFVFVLLLAFIKRRFPNQNIIQTSRVVLGKPLGVACNLIFLGVFFSWLIIGVRDAGELVLTYLLVRTPLWIVESFFLVCLGYIAVNGLLAVARVASFAVLPTLLFRFLLTVLGFQDFAVSHILPLFSTKPVAYFQSGLILAHAFVPLGAILLIYPQLTKGKKLVPVTFGATGVAVFLFFTTVLGTIGVFGATLTERLIWPNLVLVHRISIPFLVLEQVGLLFLIVWLTIFLIAGSFYFSVIAAGLKQQFPKLNFRWTVIGLLILVGGFGLLIPNGAIVNWLFDRIRHWIFIPVIVYPLVIYIVAFVRGIDHSIAQS